VNEPAYLTVPAVFGQIEPHAIADNRHKYWEVQLETVLPLDGEAERGGVVRFAPLIVGDPQSRNHALLRHCHVHTSELSRAER
jgi:hypothetical protein